MYRKYYVRPIQEIETKKLKVEPIQGYDPNQEFEPLKPIKKIVNFTKKECQGASKSECEKISHCSWRKESTGKRKIKAHCRKSPSSSFKIPKKSKSKKEPKKSPRKEQYKKFTQYELLELDKPIKKENKYSPKKLYREKKKKYSQSELLDLNKPIVNVVVTSEKKSTKQKLATLEIIIQQIKNDEKVDSKKLHDLYIDALYKALIPMGESKRDFIKNPLPVLEKLRHVYKYKLEYKNKMRNTQHILDKINRKVRVKKSDRKNIMQKEIVNDSEEEKSNFSIAETKKKLDFILSTAPRDIVVVESPKMHVPIYPIDLRSLTPMGWLTDNIIHAYLDLVQTRNDDRHIVKKHFDWNHPIVIPTHVIDKMARSGIELVKIIQKSMVGVMEKLKNGGTNNYKANMVFIPFNIDNRHWTLIIVDFRKLNGFEVLYLDSIAGNFNTPVVQSRLHKIVQIFKMSIAMFYSELYKDIPYQDDPSKSVMQRSFGRIDSLHTSIREITNLQRQLNGYDCGVFVCRYADAISRNKSLTDVVFDSENVERPKIIYELLNMKLLKE